MRNRAKCKLCQDIIESFHLNDYVSCKCGEITIAGGSHKFIIHETNPINLLRVDDNGNEIIVKYQEKSTEKNPENIPEEPPKELNKEEMIGIFDSMIKADEQLPENARHTPPSYYDLLRYMLVLSNILKK